MEQKLTTRLGDIVLEGYEKINEYGEVLTIISHASVNKFVNDKIFNGEFEVIRNSLGLDMTDPINEFYERDVDIRICSNGAVFHGHGQIKPWELTDKIKKDNPGSICENRALDAAFFNLLGCEKKLYSSLLNIEGKNITNQTQAPKKEPVAPPPVTFDTSKSSVVKEEKKPEPISVKEDTKVNVPEQAKVAEVTNRGEADSPFVEIEPVINPVKPTSKAVTPKESILQEVPVPKPAPQEPVKEDKKDEAKPVTVEASPEKEPDKKEQIPFDAGEVVIPTGRLQGTKLKDADEAYLDWFKSLADMEPLPPRYTKEFVSAYKAFMAARG